jgi:hypothetical protein
MLRKCINRPLNKERQKSLFEASWRGFSEWFKLVAVGREPSGISPRFPWKTGRLAPFRYG